MATYKKRGYKPKNKKEEAQLEEMESTTAEVFSTLDESASKTEEWVAKNQNYILGFISLVALAVLGYLGYDQFVQKPKELEATNEMYQAQKYFEQALAGANKDSLFTLSLEGAEGKYGFLEIIEKYAGTDAANVANYSAGIAYLNMNDYEKAVEYLSEFESDDAILGALAKGGIGDAFSQLGQNAEALDYYERAASHDQNDLITPRYLFKAGVVAMELGNKDKALALFNKIKDEYPNSEEGRTIDIFIGKVENL
ncbi:tol-pal system YbgF family protein [Sungkyunkwania multivorans]|uniref:Tol-pal system YbgF family protein n=1 Tax=Sungkyunkwania multivorans TaxID=1173618 RepID=A0ABW3CVL6_9FLAO